ncbi:DUF2164 family protein [Pontiella sulfatireligans]|uniref:DUF2164 domain-containing protein n=1 Tax=Pontiella sulfatireligans TaxID=2750658 RepID=A0A6C2UKW6_9BACT|nr:DUF2164 family protein [Pontiella sulfatireligans]VGO20885.1 hypothetical protein SCARR_02952 [Pontiella sulfatireligans]
MEVKLSDTQQSELRRKLVGIYFDEFDEEISDFKADRLLDAFIEKLAPAIYNTAIQDMKQFMFTQLEDLEALFEKK